MTERVVTIPEAIELVLDMVPDRRLAPNNSGTKSGWTKGPWIEAQRKQAKACVENNYTIGDALESPVSVEVLIYWGKSLKAGKVRARIEQDRRFDWDSCTVMVKPMIDGVPVVAGPRFDGLALLLQRERVRRTFAGAPATLTEIGNGAVLIGTHTGDYRMTMLY